MFNVKFHWKKSAAGQWLAVGLMSAGLTACGGGGSGSVAPAPTAQNSVQTGVLIDSPVSGIAYETDSRSGVTNAAGEFEYLAGETVAFSLGSLPLGEAAGDARVTLFDLAGVESVPETLDALYDSITEEAADRPLHKAINIAALLQTLDADGNPDNGIEIPSAVAARFDDASLWLEQPYWRFENSIRLRRIVRAAVDAEEMTARAQVRAASALTHLMEQAELDASIYYARRIETDLDGLAGAERVHTRTFDPDVGRLTSSEQDYDGDGSVDNALAWTYDDGGRLTRYEYDPDGDGNAEETHVYTYSDFGDLVYRENRNAADEVIYSDDRTYDADGNLVARSVVNTRGNDTRERWFVNDQGVRTAYELDTDGDGTWDRHDDLVYDDQDRWIERSIDRDNDGSVDQYHTRAWHALGMMTYEGRDNDNDGEVDVETEWVYSDDGVVQSYEVRYPTSEDQRNALRIDYTYDADGRLTRIAEDRGIDETLDRIRTYTYSTSTDGLELTEQAYDNDADGSVDRRTVQERDASGLLVRRTDYTADGAGSETSEVTEFTYDDLDRLVERTSPDAVVTYSDFLELPLGLAI